MNKIVNYFPSERRKSLRILNPKQVVLEYKATPNQLESIIGITTSIGLNGLSCKTKSVMPKTINHLYLYFEFEGIKLKNFGTVTWLSEVGDELGVKFLSTPPD